MQSAEVYSAEAAASAAKAGRRVRIPDEGRVPASSGTNYHVPLHPSSFRLHPSSDIALTLIELLLVMAIMTIIVSAIAVAAFGAQRRAQVKATKALLDKLALGLDLYRNTYRIYVPQDLAADDDAHSTYPLWQALEYDGRFLSVGAKYKEKGDTFTDPGTGAKVPRYIYQDAWRKPLKYECQPPHKQYTITSGGPDLDMSTSGDNIVRE